MLPTITIDGRLVADPELRFTPSGKAACNIRIAASDSKKDDAGNWETTEQIFISATLWELDGEQAAETLRKGDRVVVTGRIYQREFETTNGDKRTALELKFPTVGKAVVGRKAERQAPAATTPATDPWATTPRHDEPPF